MAYPKREKFEKTAFIAKVFNLLKTNGKLVQHNNLAKETDLDKKYQSALRYSREMGYTFDDVAKAPNSDLEVLSAPTDGTVETTVETVESANPTTEEPEVRVTSMTAEEVQEHIRNHTSSSPYKCKQQNAIKQKKSERKKMLLEKHYEILDWLQCIDDGIIKGDYIEAKRMIDTLDGYADKLHNLLDRVYVDRAEKVLKQLAELESVLGKEEIKKINEGIGAYVPTKE